MDQRNLKPAHIQSVEDLKKLPILTKEDIRRSGKQLLAVNLSQMKVSWTKTGGTTGEPMHICKNVECGAWSGMCYERGLEWGGKTVNEPTVRLFGGSLGIGANPIAAQVGAIFRRDLFIPAFELTAENARSYLSRIRRNRYRFVIGYASAIYRLATWGKELGEELELSAVFPTAELLLPEWSRAIEKIFHCSIFPYYGCGEVNSLGFSHRDVDGYLIPEEHALIEIVRVDGSSHFHGEGRFLVTDLDNYAMPIVRYSNGDAGVISQHAEQFPFNRIDRLDGRSNSLLMTDRGDLISGVIGTHVFRLTSSVESYRIIQEEPLRINIKVVPKNQLSNVDRALICSLFAKYLGKQMLIDIEEVPNLPSPPSGKSVFVINRCLQ